MEDARSSATVAREDVGRLIINMRRAYASSSSSACGEGEGEGGVEGDVVNVVNDGEDCGFTKEEKPTPSADSATRLVAARRRRSSSSRITAS